MQLKKIIEITTGMVDCRCRVQGTLGLHLRRVLTLSSRPARSNEPRNCTTSSRYRSPPGGRLTSA